MSKLFVGNVAFSTTEEDLHEYFKQNGFEVAAAQIITDRDTGRAKGFGFVTLKNGSQMRQAIADLNGKRLDGRALTINEAIPKKPRA